MQRYKVVVVCCTADETDVHTIRVNGWGESEAEYNARRKIQKFHRHEYEKITVTRIEKSNRRLRTCCTLMQSGFWKGGTGEV